MPEKQDKRSKRGKPDKRKKRATPDKPDFVFNVPPEVKKAQQSGWVYRSDASKSPAAPPRPAPPAVRHSGATRATARPAPAPPRARSSWVTDLLVLPFSVPLCLIVSLLPQAPRRQSS
jgi:hypothetical protein